MLYKIADAPNDLLACKHLAALEGLEDADPQFPTIMAFDEKELVGFIATHPRSDMILAGPLVMRSGRMRPFTAIRMCELYEQVMIRLGVTSVIFGAEPGSFLDKGMRRWFPDIEPYASDEDGNWFTWKLSSRRAA